MIRFEQVSKRYDNGFDALLNLSFELERGEMAFLTGHSGAGKTTLLKLILLMERPTAGRVLLGGKDVGTLSRAAVPFFRRRMGMVFQDHQLLFDRSVYDNVALPLIITGYRPRETGRRVRAALDKLGLLDKEHMNPRALSGGEQQRVGIARAVVNKPSILIADEPTGNLDPDLSAEIMDLFDQFAQVGVTVLVASHDISLIERFQRRVLRLRQGQLIEDGYPDFLGVEP